jgi:hypothetical protein
MCPWIYSADDRGMAPECGCKPLVYWQTEFDSQRQHQSMAGGVWLTRGVSYAPAATFESWACYQIMRLTRTDYKERFAAERCV